jgi:GT2 family glycosyltransferase
MSSTGNSDLVVVVIVNWERPEDTIQCIRSILDSSYPTIQIVVVDNGSRDNSAEKITQTFPGISLVTLTENLGFAGGYNTGINHARELNPSLIFLLNNDTVVDRQAIGILVDSDWDVSIPKINYYDYPQLIWAAGARWRAFPPTIKMIGFQKLDGQVYNRSYPLEYATGCALMIKKQVFEKVPGFDPMYINYFEDYDFSFRIKQAGFSMGFVPEARILHKVSRSLGQSSPQRWFYLGRNTVLFYRKGNRFPGYTLWSVLSWIILREILQGNAAYIPSFWKGVREGIQITGNIQ